jgi:hypothetical protein
MTKPLTHQEHAQKDADRLERKGYGPGGLLASKPVLTLTRREQLLVEYAFRGCQIKRLCDLVGREVGDLWTFEEAADALKIKRRKLRYLQTQRVFQQAVAAEVEAMRTSAKAGAMHTIVDIAKDKGDDSAATKKVRLQAASAILGDAVGPPPQRPQQVNVNVGVQLSAGVVIRAKHNPPPSRLEPETIEEQ